jgi:D-glycero-D-manno-heptose 1,7-bisphosphate phosphatase
VIVPVLLLDIDGTVRQGKDDPLGRFVNGPDDVQCFQGAIVRIMEAKASDYPARVIGISNQGGIALGHVTDRDVEAAMAETQRQCQGLFDMITYCRHHPDAPNPAMRSCFCRKPAVGMAIGSLSMLGLSHPGERYTPATTIMVGDRNEDRDMATALGVEFQWAKDWRAG